MEQQYGILMTIMTQQDLGSELMGPENRPFKLSLLGAIKKAKQHAKDMQDAMVPDWIYDIVPLDSSYRKGSSIATYISCPEFKRSY